MAMQADTTVNEGLDQRDYPERFLRRVDVCKMTTIPPTTLYEYIKKGFFPKGYKLIGDTEGRHGSVVWKLSEVLNFMNSRERAE